MAAAVFVITSDDIRRSGATNIPDLLRMVPGLDVAQINSNTWAINPLDRDPAFACHRVLSFFQPPAISEPILELARAAFAVSLHKDYSIRAAKRCKDEIHVVR